jgi:hypothetical protein
LSFSQPPNSLSVWYGAGQYFFPVSQPSPILIQ